MYCLTPRFMLHKQDSDSKIKGSIMWKNYLKTEFMTQPSGEGQFEQPEETQREIL